MIRQFFPGMDLKNTLEVENGDTLDLGNHQLTFVFAPMVHWPEVMMTYESSEKILFAADGFGKFGALDAEEDWACEARRYYIGIVGKYGAQVIKYTQKSCRSGYREDLSASRTCSDRKSGILHQSVRYMVQL